MAKSDESVKGKVTEFRDHLQDGAERFGRGVEREAKNVERRIKEGLQSSLKESRHPNRRFGRPPALSRRPPSGRPPTGRPPSVDR